MSHRQIAAQICDLIFSAPFGGPGRPIGNPVAKNRTKTVDYCNRVEHQTQAHFTDPKSTVHSIMSMQVGEEAYISCLTEEEVAMARKRFDAMDKDGNGTIDRAEARSDVMSKRKSFMGNSGPETAEEDGALGRVAEKEVSTMFQIMDDNGDGVISFEEYLNATEKTKRVALQAQERRKHYHVELDKAYEAYAKDEAFEGLTEEEFKRHKYAFMMIDINGDGCIERHEAVDEIARKRRSIFGNAPEVDGKEDPVVIAATLEVDAMFAKMDVNHDEVISFREYLLGMVTK